MTETQGRLNLDGKLDAMPPGDTTAYSQQALDGSGHFPRGRQILWLAHAHLHRIPEGHGRFESAESFPNAWTHKHLAWKL
jgi:hypothetical protein